MPGIKSDCDTGASLLRTVFTAGQPKVFQSTCAVILLRFPFDPVGFQINKIRQSLCRLANCIDIHTIRPRADHTAQAACTK